MSMWSCAVAVWKFRVSVDCGHCQENKFDSRETRKTIELAGWKSFRMSDNVRSASGLSRFEY